MSRLVQTENAARPSRLELECLQVLWRTPASTVEQVRAALQHPLAHTTVMTLLNRLAAKGLVTRSRTGRAWTYAAAVDHESARAEALRHLLAQWFGNDPQALVRELARLGGAVSRAPVAGAVRRGRRSAAAAAEEEQFRPAHIDESLL